MDMYQESENGHLVGADFTEECQEDAEPSVLSYIRPPPSAFMGPKCALWDCLRPALGSEWYRDYCSSFHATLSLSEESTGLTPVVRPGGIHLKDSLLLVAANAKAQGKKVGIPKCEGAVTAKTPWNATDLFDVTLLEGETVREWLFFDKHKRAFERGRRKQRSLPDHSGRGWHESRKLLMTEFGGQKKSYFLDPQPFGCFQWHLYEYEISNNSNAYALYKLQLKKVNEKKGSQGKSNKGFTGRSEFEEEDGTPLKTWTYKPQFSYLLKLFILLCNLNVQTIFYLLIAFISISSRFCYLAEVLIFCAGSKYMFAHKPQHQITNEFPFPQETPIQDQSTNKHFTINSSN